MKFNFKNLVGSVSNFVKKNIMPAIKAGTASLVETSSDFVKDLKKNYNEKRREEANKIVEEAKALKLKEIKPKETNLKKETSFEEVDLNKVARNRQVNNEINRFFHIAQNYNFSSDDVQEQLNMSRALGRSTEEALEDLYEYANQVGIPIEEAQEYLNSHNSPPQIEEGGEENRLVEQINLKL